MQQIQEVIIIGAGASGIGAAYTLHKLRIPFLILESRDRIGGRMHTIALDGSTIHLGACYIHDPTPDHAILKAMKELGVEGLPNNYSNQQYLREGGEEIPKSEVEKGREVYSQWIKFIRGRAKESMEDTDLERCLSEFQSMNMHLDPNAVKLARFMIKFDAFFQASDLRYLSLKEFSHDRTAEDLVPPGGYHNVISTIYQASNPTTRFNQKVVGIDYSEELVRLTTQDGAVYQARTVISSLPLGVLKKNIVAFRPELPETHLRAIKNITCGIANKIYLKFEQDFWSEKGDWIFLYSDEPFKFNVIVNEAQTSKNVMCVKVAGFESTPLYQKSDQQIVKEVLQQLNKYFDKDKMNLKGYYLTRWHQDENSYGSYSTLKPGESRTSMAQLSQPLQDKVWFVGEHCIETKFAFAHGAFESGQKAAAQVAARLKTLGRRGKL